MEPEVKEHVSCRALTRSSVKLVRAAAKRALAGYEGKIRGRAVSPDVSGRRCGEAQTYGLRKGQQRLWIPERRVRPIAVKNGRSDLVERRVDETEGVDVLYIVDFGGDDLMIQLDGESWGRGRRSDGRRERECRSDARTEGSCDYLNG
jgi:hypothetical protein